MKITLAISSLRCGGAERVAAWLASELAKGGHSVNLVVNAPAEADFYPCDERVSIVRPQHASANTLASCLRWADARVLWGIQWRIHSFRYRCFQAIGYESSVETFSNNFTRFARQVRRIAVEQYADAVISFTDDLNLAVLAAMRDTGIPVIVNEVSQPFSREALEFESQRVRPLLYRKASAVVVLSEEVLGLAGKHWPGTHSRVIPNPLMLKLELPEADVKSRVVLSVGRLHEIKDHLSLIEAWALSQAAEEGWTLRILGEGPMRPVLEAAILRLGLTGSVFLPGVVRDVSVHYASSSVFVLPSKVEGFGNALIEAMAHGCACIATTCPGGPKEILEMGKTGLMVPPSNPVALAEALDRITADESLRKQLSVAATRRSKEYCPSRVYAKWEELFHEVASASAGSPGPSARIESIDPTCDRPHSPSRQIILVGESLWGGTGRVLSWLSSRLAEDGHKITLILKSPKASDWYTPSPKVNIIRVVASPRSQTKPLGVNLSPPVSDSPLNGAMRGCFGMLRTLSRMLGVSTLIRTLLQWLADVRFGNAVCVAAHQHNSSVVVSFLRNVNIAVLLGMRHSTIPVLVSERSHPFAYNDLDWIRRWLRPVLYRRAAQVIVLTEDIARLAAQRWSIPRPRVLQNAIPLDVPPSLPEMEQRPRVVLYVGRMHPQKDPLSLIEAWSLSGAARFGWRLVMVGDGELSSEIETAVERFHVRDSVELTGVSNNVLTHYLSARVFVLPSILEGFPNALVEAMACECACIATTCPGGAREILGEGEYGLLVPPKSPIELSKALDRITSDPSLCQRLGRAAKGRSRSYHPDIIYAQWLDVLGVYKG